MSLDRPAYVRGLSLEQLLTSKVAGFGLSTATPLQRAYCRVVQGLSLDELATNPDVLDAMGDVEGVGNPSEVLFLSGIRTGKSLLAAVTATYASQHANLDGIRPGEVPRYSIVSLSLDLARVVFGHLVGSIEANPCMRELMIEPPTADSLLLRHPSGMPVEIKVVAGSRAGASLAARWSIGATFDEAPRMLGSDDAVINLDDARANLIGRLRPGAQITLIGSPWAPYGPVYRLVTEHWRKPTQRLVVIRAPAHKVNPEWWTEARCKALRTSDPEAYAVDVEAQFRAPETSLLGTAEVDEAATIPHTGEPPNQMQSYVAAMDPATRGNAWTLTIGTRAKENYRVVLARQWIGNRSEPLAMRKVLSEVADILAPYRVKHVYSDRYGLDLLRDAALPYGISIQTREWSPKEHVDAYLKLRELVREKRITFPNDPYLKADLQRIVLRTTQTGSVIHLPITSDGRHCDYAPTLPLLLSQYIDDRKSDPLTDDQRARREEEEMERRAIEELESRRSVRR